MRILITGADRGLGFGLTKLLLEEGHEVFAGRHLTAWKELEQLAPLYLDRLRLVALDVSSEESVAAAVDAVRAHTDALDAVINNAAVTGRTDDEEPMRQNYAAMLTAYNVNAVGPVRVTEAFYPLLERGEGKRLIYVSSEAGSVTESGRTDFYGYCMTKSALNMYVKILFNRLRPSGYRFRLYHPGWVKSYMSGRLSEEGELTIEEAAKLAADYFFRREIDEDALVLRGYDGHIFEY